MKFRKNMPLGNPTDLDEKMQPSNPRNVINTNKSAKRVLADLQIVYKSKFLSLSDIENDILRTKIALKRQLQTLNYISLIESSIFIKAGSIRERETRNLKTSVQESVIDIVNKLNYYKLLLQAKQRKSA